MSTTPPARAGRPVSDYIMTPLAVWSLTAAVPGVFTTESTTFRIGTAVW